MKCTSSAETSHLACGPQCGKGGRIQRVQKVHLDNDRRRTKDLVWRLTIKHAETRKEWSTTPEIEKNSETGSYYETVS